MLWLQASAISSVIFLCLSFLLGSKAIMESWSSPRECVETWHDSHLKPVPTLTQSGLDRRHHKRCIAATVLPESIPESNADMNSCISSPHLGCFPGCRDPETSIKKCLSPIRQALKGTRTSSYFGTFDRGWSLKGPIALLLLHSIYVTWRRIVMVKSGLSHSSILIFLALCCPKNFSIQAIQTAQPFLRQFRPLAFSATG